MSESSALADARRELEKLVGQETKLERELALAERKDRHSKRAAGARACNGQIAWAGPALTRGEFQSCGDA